MLSYFHCHQRLWWLRLCDSISISNLHSQFCFFWFLATNQFDEATLAGSSNHKPGVGCSNVSLYTCICLCVCATPSAARPESRLWLLALIVVFFLSPSPSLSFLCWRNLRPEIMSKVTQFSKQYRTAKEKALWKRKEASPRL